MSVQWEEAHGKRRNEGSWTKKRKMSGLSMRVARTVAIGPIRRIAKKCASPVVIAATGITSMRKIPTVSATSADAGNGAKAK